MTTFSVLKNGGFDSNTNLDNWTTDGATLSITGGYLQLATPGRGYSLMLVVPVIPGKTYIVTLPVIANTSEALPYPTYVQWLYIFKEIPNVNMATDIRNNNRYTGTYTSTIVATSPVFNIYLHTQASTGYIRVDNISVIEQP